MTTRAIRFVVSVDGASETGSAFLRLAEQEREAGRAAQELREQQQQQQRSMQAVSQIATEVGRAMHLFAQGLERTHPEMSRFLEFSSQVTTSLGRNVQQFGLFGGAAVTALETARAPLIDAIEQWSRFDELIQSARVGLSGLNPELDRLMGIGDRSVGISQGHRDPEGNRPPGHHFDVAADARRWAAEHPDEVRGRRRGGGPDPLDTEEQNIRAFYDRVDAAETERARQHDEIERSRNEKDQAAADVRNQIAEQEHQIAINLMELRHDREVALMREANEEFEKSQRERERATQAHSAMIQQYQAITQPLVGSLVKSLSTVVAGTQSADKAFEGLLSSFLQFISEQSALRAAFEFAEAIASFPNPATMASHAAAGIAFTAVAVAAGAGAVATAPQPPSGSPASPQRGHENEHSGGGDIYVLWNQPMIAVGSMTEIGKQINSLGAGARARLSSQV